MALPQLADPNSLPAASEAPAHDYGATMGSIMESFGSIKDDLVREIAYSSVESRLAKIAGHEIHIDRPEEIALKNSKRASALYQAEEDLAVHRVLHSNAMMANMDPEEKKALKLSDPSELLTSNPDGWRALWNGRFAKDQGYQITEGDLIKAQPALNLKAVNAGQAAALTQAAEQKAASAAGDEQQKQVSRQREDINFQDTMQQRALRNIDAGQKDISTGKAQSPLGKAFNAAVEGLGDFSTGDSDMDTGQGSAKFTQYVSSLYKTNVPPSEIGTLVRQGEYASDIADVLSSAVDEQTGLITFGRGDTLGADEDAVFNLTALQMQAAAREGGEVGDKLRELPGLNAAGVDLPSFEAYARNRYSAAKPAESWQSYYFGALLGFDKQTVQLLEDNGVTSLAPPKGAAP